MVDTVIMSLLVLDVGIQVVIIDKIMKAYQQRNTFRDDVEEEENLTRYESYDNKDQQKGWEFKIVRSSSNGFRGRRALSHVCEEEAKSGWILLEKLDDQRLRFRRPLSAREKDHLSKRDPYRTHYGLSSETESAISIVLLIAILSVPAYFGFTMMQNIFRSIPTTSLPSAPIAPQAAPAVKPSPKPKAPPKNKPVPIPTFSP